MQPCGSLGRTAAALLLLLSACTSHEQGPPSPPVTLPPTTEAPAAPPPTTAPPAPQSPAASPAGQDFSAEVRLLYRVVACAGGAALPPSLDAATIQEHCAALQPRIERHRKRYVALAQPFLAALRPSGLPTSVVYPFGGGDLLSALTTYPDGREYTTLSLELAGDPRRLATLDKASLATSLALIRQEVAPLLAQNNSTSENLMKGQRGEIPGQIAFFLVALAVHGYEPVSLRYFRVEAEGTLHYYTADEIADTDRAPAGRLKGEWTPPDFSPAFSNAEIVFRSPGADPGETRVHRHLAANLADGYLARHPGILKHLEGKGRISAMTKAASYLLWRSDFAKMRNYLLGHMELMFADSTGIPPSFAEPAGFTLETYGRFRGSFLPANRDYNEEFRKLWSSQPERPLPFRYGYPDSARGFHLMVARRGATPARAARRELGRSTAPSTVSAHHKAGGRTRRPRPQAAV